MSSPSSGHGFIGHPVKQCVNPQKRPAWHELSVSEKMEYIRAVNCLPTKPSYIHPNSTVYDDFTWLHIVDGDQIHFAAANLPWHRWHLHLYEAALQRECGFKGVLPYWDWELDNEGTKESDFFNPVHGFGGNSLNTDMYEFNEQNIPLFDDKHCIKDGPFAWLQPQWTGAIEEGPTFWPHCLTRRYSEQFIKPGIAKLLALTDYEEFNLKVEDLHTWLAQALMGEYLTLQASNDPTFFPHLAKIDQIWWRWQQLENQRNLWSYNGQARRSTPNKASLDDIMIFHAYPGMQRDVIRARDVMSTKTDLLCYTY
ncbi:hypothetical protein B0O99DRAFT_530259 [Bisporella sp. PMI_857]|nr:hypothetical protein B0O99DRAFT_530259 [Bisporella sp. PMI_857]